FTRNGEEVTFHPGPAPSRREIADVAERVGRRMRKWLRRRNLLQAKKTEDTSNETPARSPLEACIQAPLFGGECLRIDRDEPSIEPGDEHVRERGKSPRSAEVLGFHVHAGVVIDAGDREGLERLCRYGARPAFALERISLLPDGRVAYRL